MANLLLALVVTKRLCLSAFLKVIYLIFFWYGIYLPLYLSLPLLLYISVQHEEYSYSAFFFKVSSTSTVQRVVQLSLYLHASLLSLTLSNISGPQRISFVSYVCSTNEFAGDSRERVSRILQNFVQKRFLN